MKQLFHVDHFPALTSGNEEGFVTVARFDIKEDAFEWLRDRYRGLLKGRVAK